jgi:hypothetical protein
VACHRVEDGAEPRLVQRRTADVGVQLRPERAELAHRAVQLTGGSIGVVHRQGRGEAGEAVRMGADQLRHLVVRGAGQVGGGRPPAEFLQRRHGEREHLPVIAEQVHRPPAGIEIGQRRVLADPGPVSQYPFADVRARGDRLQALGVGRREYVSEGVNLRHGPLRVD